MSMLKTGGPLGKSAKTYRLKYKLRVFDVRSADRRSRSMTYLRSSRHRRKHEHRVAGQDLNHRVPLRFETMTFLFKNVIYILIIY